MDPAVLPYPASRDVVQSDSVNNAFLVKSAFLKLIVDVIFGFVITVPFMAQLETPGAMKFSLCVLLINVVSDSVLLLLYGRHISSFHTADPAFYGAMVGVVLALVMYVFVEGVYKCLGKVGMRNKTQLLTTVSLVTLLYLLVFRKSIYRGLLMTSLDTACPTNATVLPDKNNSSNTHFVLSIVVRMLYFLPVVGMIYSREHVIGWYFRETYDYTPYHLPDRSEPLLYVKINLGHFFLLFFVEYAFFFSEWYSVWYSVWYSGFPDLQFCSYISVKEAVYVNWTVSLAVVLCSWLLHPGIRAAVWRLHSGAHHGKDARETLSEITILDNGK